MSELVHQRLREAAPIEHRVLLTVVEAALLLGIGRTTIYELLASGELPAVRIGRSRRIPRQAIDEYVGRLLQIGGGGN